MNATRAAVVFTAAVVGGFYIWLRHQPIAVGPAGSGTLGSALGALESAGEVIGIVTPRGIRDNNPGNLEYTPAFTWDGQIGTDGAYLKFATPQDGSRALGHDLRNAIAEGYDTVDLLIAHYAPPSANDTAAYQADVATRLGRARNAKLYPEDAPRVAGGVAIHENGAGPWTAPDGTVYTDADVETWAALA